MKFIDEAILKVEAGNGGSGYRHFHREKFVPLGGPDGGNGGAGGSVILKADRNKNTLLDFQFQPRWKATDGERGDESNRDGKSGQDLVIPVPVGTQIFDYDQAKDQTGSTLIADLGQDGETFVLAKGGRGGKGNAFFKSPTNRAPEHFQPGEKGEAGTFVLSLKLVAEVGLIGFPNAGKSTLISRISAARPKIADYPFTTVTPNLGVVAAPGNRSFVVADIPGLIPGAHQGKGLGIRFLKHVERTRILAHLIDPLQLDLEGNPVSPEAAFEAINFELRSFSEELSKKPQLIVLTKSDAIADREALADALRFFEHQGLKTLVVSSVSGEGIDELLKVLASMVFSG
jgi:GTPase